MDLPGQSKVRGIDTEDLGDNVKKKAQFNTSNAYTKRRVYYFLATASL